MLGNSTKTIELRVLGEDAIRCPASSAACRAEGEFRDSRRGGGPVMSSAARMFDDGPNADAPAATNSWVYSWVYRVTTTGSPEGRVAQRWGRASCPSTTMAFRWTVTSWAMARTRPANNSRSIQSSYRRISGASIGGAFPMRQCTAQNPIAHARCHDEKNLFGRESLALESY